MFLLRPGLQTNQQIFTLCRLLGAGTMCWEKFDKLSKKAALKNGCKTLCKTDLTQIWRDNEKVSAFNHNLF